MSETVVLVRDGLSVSISSHGTNHKVRIVPDDDHTYELVSRDTLPPIGSYVEIDYTTTGDAGSELSLNSTKTDDGASGTAYGLVVNHVSDTEFTILWSYNYQEFDAPDQRRLFGRGAHAPNQRILTTDSVVVTNEDVRVISADTPPNQVEFVLTYPGKKVSRLGASTLRDIVKTVSWYRAVQCRSDDGSKRHKVDFWAGPGHASLYADLYSIGNARCREEMNAAAEHLYGTPDMDEGNLPYYKQLECLATWSNNLERASLIK